LHGRVQLLEESNQTSDAAWNKIALLSTGFVIDLLVEKGIAVFP
jgi:hypothetical protein